MSERDPNYRSTTVYEYGDVRQVILDAYFSSDGCLMWNASFECDGISTRIGGNPGPFEALANALKCIEYEVERKR